MPDSGHLRINSLCLARRATVSDGQATAAPNSSPRDHKTASATRMDESPFIAQELVDHCIDFLHNSMPDLRTCALVSRSWVPRAQSLIFWKIDIGGRSRLGILWERLQRTLETSPHLIRLIRRLRIGLKERTPLPVLSRICNFTFTHLERVRIHIWGNLILQAALALQRLFALPTLRCVKLIMTRSPDAEMFLNMFERCSPTIRKLHLHFSGDLPPSLPGIPRDHARAPIRLISLDIKTSGSLNPQLLPTLRPFSLSHLKALSISSLSGIAWHELAPVMGTIEILSIVVRVCMQRPCSRRAPTYICTARSHWSRSVRLSKAFRPLHRAGGGA